MSSSPRIPVRAESPSQQHATVEPTAPPSSRPLDETIVAPATAAGAAGLAVVRLSGSEALTFAAMLFRGFDLTRSESHRAHHGHAVDARGRHIDEVLALVLRAPRSYTGEDTVEISCHGSPQVVEEIVAAALEVGARLAGPGEFTRRAFLNGKLDLCQAEAVADLIAAESNAARRAALEQLRGSLSARLSVLRGELLHLLGDVEATIDFVEEGIEFFDVDAAQATAQRAAERLDQLLATASDGLLLRSGIRVSLAGAPNVGKSSLFNRILQSPRSIVTEHPGTTRDVVRESMRLGGLMLTLEDTAGIRASTGDPVEAVGIARSRQSHAEADIVLHVLDATRKVEHEQELELGKLPEESSLVVLNKIDLLEADVRESLVREPRRAQDFLDGMRGLSSNGDREIRDVPACVAVSAATGAGIDILLEALVQRTRLRRLTLQNDAVVSINQRHREALLRAREALSEFANDLVAPEPPEILALDLRRAVLSLDEISGEQFTEEILDSIFSRFCIGK